MRPNNRQRSRGGRSGGGGSGGGGGGSHHHKQHHNPNRPPNRNQIFDSSGPDVRVRGNAHQVFDKYQALAREAGSSGDRILAEAYWQYADHYFRMIQTMGGFGQRNNVGYGDGEEGQPSQQSQGQAEGQPQANGHESGERTSGRNDDRNDGRNDVRNDVRNDGRNDSRNDGRGDGRNDGRSDGRNDGRNDSRNDSEPGLGGVAFLQNGRNAPGSNDPSDDEQPEVPEFVPAAGRRG